MKWNSHVYDSAQCRYFMILGRDLLTELALNLKIPHVIEAYDGHFKGSTVPMVDFSTYIFKYLDTGKIKPEEYFRDAHVKKLYESEHVSTVTK